MPRLRCAASCNAQWAATPPTITAGFAHGKTVGRRNCRWPQSKPSPTRDCKAEAAQRRTLQRNARKATLREGRAGKTAKPGDRRSPQATSVKHRDGANLQSSRARGSGGNMKRFSPAGVFFLFFATIFPDFCFAQSNLPDAQLKGSITDRTGAGVGGVHVSARNPNDSQGNVWIATSTTDGQFTLTLPAGKYHIVLQKASFTQREFDFDLAAGEAKILSTRLELEQLSASVVVTAEVEPLPVQQTTAPVDVITQSDIAQRQLKTLPDALLTLPGVSIGRTGSEGGTASIFLNGGNSSYTKVLVDGTPVNEPGNAVDFANFTLDNVDKVEIVRGAESAIYGTDAVAGVIQVITHRGTTRIPEATVFAEGGNFGTGRGGAQFSGLLGRFDYSGAASYFSTDGPDDENRFLNRTLSGNFGYRLGEDNQLRLTLRNNTRSAQ